MVLAGKRAAASQRDLNGSYSLCPKRPATFWMFGQFVVRAGNMQELVAHSAGATILIAWQTAWASELGTVEFACRPQTERKKMACPRATFETVAKTYTSPTLKTEALVPMQLAAESAMSRCLQTCRSLPRRTRKLH